MITFWLGFSGIYITCGSLGPDDFRANFMVEQEEQNFSVYDQ